MASSHTIERTGRADWTLMTTIHEALHRDLDELITTTAPRPRRPAGSCSATTCAVTSPPSARQCGGRPGPSSPADRPCNPGCDPTGHGDQQGCDDEQDRPEVRVGYFSKAKAIASALRIGSTAWSMQVRRPPSVTVADGNRKLRSQPPR